MTDKIIELKKSDILKSWFALTKSMIQQNVLTIKKDDRQLSPDDIVIVKFEDELTIKV